MLDTVVISGDNACCSVVFGTLVGVLSVMWSEIADYYYRFIVHFQIGLDFLFISFLLRFFLSWTSSLSI